MRACRTRANVQGVEIDVTTEDVATAAEIFRNMAGADGYVTPDQMTELLGDPLIEMAKANAEQFGWCHSYVAGILCMAHIATQIAAERDRSKLTLSG